MNPHHAPQAFSAAPPCRRPLTRRIPPALPMLRIDPALPMLRMLPLLPMRPVANVRSQVERFFAGLATRADEVKRRCRTALQTKDDALDVLTMATTIPQAGAIGSTDPCTPHCGFGLRSVGPT